MEKNKDLLALIHKPTASFVRPDIEAHLIGSLLRNPATSLPAITTYMLPDVFTDFFHKTVYQQLLSIDQDKKKFSLNVIRARVDKALPMTAEQNAMRIEELLSFESENFAADAEMLYDMYLSRTTIAFHERARNELAAGGNPYEINQRTAEELKVIAETSFVKTRKNKNYDLINFGDVIERPASRPPLITIDQTPVVRRNDHTLIIGKAKSRKSLFVTQLITQYYHNIGKPVPKEQRVVLFDTEQDKEDVWLMRDRIHKACGVYVRCISMRSFTVEQRKDVIQQLISDNAYDMVIIDGVRDLMRDLLDSDESTNLINFIETLIVKHGVAVVNVLHINKTDNNARGHIGTELINKAMCVVRLEYDPKTTHTRVTCEAARRAPFEPYSFTHGPDGAYLHIGAVIETPEGTLTQTENVRRLETIFADGPMKYGELLASIQAEFAIGKGKALSHIADFMRRGYMIKTGKYRDPNAIYKLVANSQNAATFTAPPPVQEPDLFSSEPESLVANDPEIPF